MWTIWHSPVGTGMSLRRGKSGSQNWASAMVGSSMLTTALRSLAVIRTTLLWNSLLRSSRAWPVSIPAYEVTQTMVAQVSRWLWDQMTIAVTTKR